MIFTHELKTDKSDKLAKEVDEFIRNGGEIREIDNSGNFVSKSQCGISSHRHRRPVTDFNVQSRIEKEERLKVQQPMIQKYVSAVGFVDKWKRLIDESGTNVNDHMLYRTWKGQGSIVCPDTWKKLSDAINKIIEEYAGTPEALSKEQRIEYQQPILQNFYENYKKKNKWKDLSKKCGGVVSGKHLLDVHRGRTTVASPEDFKKVEQAIAELLK